MEQLNGFSPKCVLECVFKFELSENDLLHTKHLKGFSPEWVLQCLIKFEFSAKVFKQMEHLSGFSVWWIFEWRVNWDIKVNDFLHTSHWTFFGLPWTAFVVLTPDAFSFEFFGILVVLTFSVLIISFDILSLFWYFSTMTTDVWGFLKQIIIAKLILK